MTILTVVTDPAKEASDLRYAERLAGLCERAGARYKSEVVKARSAIGAVMKVVRHYDLLVLGASAGWALRQYAFGPVEDRLAKRVPIPVLMLRKVGEHDLVL